MYGRRRAEDEGRGWKRTRSGRGRGEKRRNVIPPRTEKLAPLRLAWVERGDGDGRGRAGVDGWLLSSSRPHLLFLAVCARLQPLGGAHSRANAVIACRGERTTKTDCRRKVGSTRLSRILSAFTTYSSVGRQTTARESLMGRGCMPERKGMMEGTLDIAEQGHKIDRSRRAARAHNQHNVTLSVPGPLSARVRWS